MRAEHIETVIVGGGQAGLATGYHLARRGAPVRDPGGERADRRLVAQALGFASPVHTGALQRAAGPALSRRRRGRFPARTTSPTTWRTTRPRSSSRSGPVSAWTASRGREAATRSRPGIAGSPPTASSWRRARTSDQGCPPSPPSSIRASCSCIPASTGLERSFRTAASSSWAPRTRAPRSRSRWPANTTPGCREGTRDRSLSALGAGGIGSACRWSGSWRRTC